MDAVTTVLEALAAGTAAGVESAAETTTKDAYRRLRARLSQLLGRTSTATEIQRNIDLDSETWRPTLLAELNASGAARDPELLAAATLVMRLLEDKSAPSVEVLYSQGTVIGDHAVVSQHFSGPAPSRPSASDRQ